jgi:RNA-binding protein
MATSKKRSASASSTRSGPGPKRKRQLEKRKADERANNPTPKERELTGAQARYLRGLGHHLDPIVHIGKEGITDALVKALKEALLAHELVKVRLLQEAPIERKEAGVELAKRAVCSLAQTLGRTMLLYKRHPNKPKIVLPRGAKVTSSDE